MTVLRQTWMEESLGRSRMMFTRKSDPASTNAFRLECPPGDRSDLDQPVYAPEGRMRCGDVNGGRSRKDCSGTAKIAETPSETARERGISQAIRVPAVNP